jgi:hypothetical protein
MLFLPHTCDFLQVLEAAYEGNFEAAPLRFGEAISSRVEKAGAQYYTLELQQRNINEGFAIGAHSVAGSKFKLLMFEANEAGQWELLLQEDSTKVRAVVRVLRLLCCFSVLGLHAVALCLGSQLTSSVMLVCDA